MGSLTHSFTVERFSLASIGFRVYGQGKGFTKDVQRGIYFKRAIFGSFKVCASLNSKP